MVAQRQQVLVFFLDDFPAQRQAGSQTLAVQVREVLACAGGAGAQESLEPVSVCHLNALHLHDEARAALSPDELVRMSRLMKPAGRQTFAFAHSILRLLLGEKLGCAPADLVFHRDALGKPRLGLGSGHVEFNLSYRDGAIAIALSDAVVGVDIEEIGAAGDTQGIAQRFFSVQENRRLAKQAAENAENYFYQIWTRKEALLKAAGTGLAGISAIDVCHPLASARDANSVEHNYRLFSRPAGARHFLSWAVRV